MFIIGMLLSFLLLTSSLLQPTSSEILENYVQRHNDTAKIRMVDKIVSSLNAATTCLEKQENLLVTDVMCLRILQAYIKGIQRRWATNPAMEPMNKKVKKFSKKLTALLRRSTSRVNQAFSEDLDAFNWTIQANFWKVPKSFIHTSDTVITTVLSPLDPLKPDTSKECMINLLGSSGHPESCTYSDICRYLMTMSALSSQHRLYQTMYFLFSKMIGCTNGMFAKTEDYMNLFCSNLMDMNSEIESRNYEGSSRDTFLENIMLCGTGGFLDFYNDHWLVNILRWQDDKSGCFNTAYRSSVYGTTHASAVLGGFLYACDKYPQSFVYLTSLLRNLSKLPRP